MPTLHSRGIDDVLALLGDWVPFAERQEAQFFVGAAGFEERSPVAFERWCSAQRRTGSRALLLRYPMNVADNRPQVERFIAAASDAGVEVDWLDYERSTIDRQAWLRVVQADVQGDIVLDISSMASFAFYPLLTAVCYGAPGAKLTICYAEAQEYFPKKEEWESFQADVAAVDDTAQRARLFDAQHFQSSGVDHVYESRYYHGANVDALPSRLIMIPNFSFERVNRMISFAENAYKADREGVEWVIGMPPDQAQKGWRHAALWEMFEKPQPCHPVCTLDYRDALVTLHRLWREKHLKESLVVATVGSKSQHLGTFMFLTMHPEVGLVVSEPTQFTASSYSEGAGEVRQVELGGIGGFMERLRSWSEIEFRWDAD